MNETKESRDKRLYGFSVYLNTVTGVDMMKELESIWDGYKIMGDTPEDTAYKVGQRDAFKFLQYLANGDFADVG
jgi:hypothetical protein